MKRLCDILLILTSETNACLSNACTLHEQSYAKQRLREQSYAKQRLREQAYAGGKQGAALLPVLPVQAAEQVQYMETGGNISDRSYEGN